MRSPRALEHVICGSRCWEAPPPRYGCSITEFDVRDGADGADGADLAQIRATVGSSC